MGTKNSLEFGEFRDDVGKDLAGDGAPKLSERGWPDSQPKLI